MKKKYDIQIDHPLAHITVIPRQPVPQSVCRRTIKSIEGVLNAALVLTEESRDQLVLSCVETQDQELD